MKLLDGIQKKQQNKLVLETMCVCVSNKAEVKTTRKLILKICLLRLTLKCVFRTYVTTTKICQGNSTNYRKVA